MKRSQISTITVGVIFLALMTTLLLVVHESGPEVVGIAGFGGMYPEYVRELIVRGDREFRIGEFASAEGEYRTAVDVMEGWKELGREKDLEQYRHLYPLAESKRKIAEISRIAREIALSRNGIGDTNHTR